MEKTSASHTYSHNINAPIFVYPDGRGSGNATVESLVQKYYLVARGITENPLNTAQPFERFALPSYEILNTARYQILQRL